MLKNKNEKNKTMRIEDFLFKDVMFINNYDVRNTVHNTAVLVTNNMFVAVCKNIGLCKKNVR